MKEKYVRDVETDLYYAMKVLDHSDINTRHFGEYSHIFRTTNEPLNALSDYFKDRNKVLSVTCSGDQVLKCISYGSKEIDTFDISIFPKYFLDMKIAACQKLSKQEFYDMFYSPFFDKMDLDHLYHKFSDKLPMSSRYFWDGLFQRYSWTEIYDSPLFTDRHGVEVLLDDQKNMKNYSFLADDEYEKLRENAKNVKVNSITCDITDISKKTDDSYDLIFLSNVIDYTPVEKYRNYIKNLKVNKNGIILNTFGYRCDVNRMKDYQVLKDDGFVEEKTDRLCKLLVKKF